MEFPVQLPIQFYVVGLNHRTSPLEVRERVATTRDQLPGALRALGARGMQGVVLSTCNRSELYSADEDPSAPLALEEFIADHFTVPMADLGPYIYRHHQADCVRHLFRVASGLDSMIVGEGEILRQVRDAFGAAVQADTVEGPLSRLFHQALRVGKKVRRGTGISRNALSVSKACVDLARGVLGDLSQLRVMVIGAGDAGELAAKALVDSGVKDVVVANRTYSRAEELAQGLGGEAIPFHDMPRALSDVDIAIACTDASGFVVGEEMVREAVARRIDKPLFLIDIAVPRDIDPATGSLDGVHLYDVDHLQAISEANRLEREREARQAEEIVDREVRQFLESYRTLEVVPTITAIRDWATEVRDGELSRLLKKLDHKLTPGELESVEAMARAIVNKLLHNPTTYLRQHSNSRDLKLVREIFGLVDEDAPASAGPSGLHWMDEVEVLG